MITVFIQGVKFPVIMDSMRILNKIEERGTATFSILDKGNNYRFMEGQPVVIATATGVDLSPFGRFNISRFNMAGYGGGQPFKIDENYFTGIIQSVETEIYNKSNITRAKHFIECVDYHYSADKRLVAKAYENRDISYIVNDLFASYLLDEDLVIGQIDSGFEIIQASFNYILLSEVLDDLVNRTGFTWYIDKDRKFYFVKRTAFTYPDTITEKHMIDKSIRLSTNNTKYRNRQIIKNVKDITSEQAEIMKGDGENKTFLVGYSIAKVPTVETSTDGNLWYPKTVGIRGLDEGFDFYWSKGEKEITQDRNATPLSDTEYIRVKYQGQIDLIVVTQDNEKVLGRKSMEESGTGLVENVYSELTETRESAFDLASQLIDKYGNASITLTFETRQEGLRVGQLLDVDMASYKFTEQLLIESVELRYIGGNALYQVKATLGTERKSWQDYFNSLYKQAKQREADTELVSEVITVPLNFRKVWNQATEPNIYTETYPLGQTPSNSLFPMFAQTDRNKVLEVYDSSGVIGRKVIAQSSGDLVAIALISGADFIGKSITKFAWYSGIDATTELGTGYKIDEQSTTEDNISSPWIKTSIEQWQVQHTSVKGW